MIIVKGNSFRLSEEIEKADSILFVDDGNYCFVESAIVENELRVLGNWKTSERTECNKPWLIIWQHGTEIPQELGDYLVANQDLAEEALIIKRLATWVLEGR